jgi:hypothetical protein
MAGGEGDVTVPIPSYLIAHPKGASTAWHNSKQATPGSSSDYRDCRKNLSQAPGEITESRIPPGGTRLQNRASRVSSQPSAGAD